MNAALPSYVFVGTGTYFADLLFHRWGYEHIRIGKYCSFSQQIKLLAGGNHKTGAVSTFPFDTLMLGNQMGPTADRSYELDQTGIEIGNDVWVGFGATVLGTVRIGDGAVIAAGAVVLTDIPAYAIAVGNPARVTKYRFSEDTIEALLRIRWWNWDAETIKRRVSKFYDLEKFVEEFDVAATTAANAKRETVTA